MDNHSIRIPKITNTFPEIEPTDNPIVVGKHEFDDYPFEEFEAAFAKNKAMLGQPISHHEYSHQSYAEIQSSIDNYVLDMLRNGGFQLFENGVLMGSRGLHSAAKVCAIYGEFFIYYNDFTNKALINLGYPVEDQVDIEKGVSKQSFMWGDLVLNEGEFYIIRGEIGRYFYARSGYELFGFPISNEERNEETKIVSQRFEKGSLEYSLEAEKTGWTFRPIMLAT